MVLNHFGIKRSLKELIEGMSYEVGGTYIFDNGLKTIQEGLKTELITANPLLFKREVREKLKKSQDIVDHINSVKRKFPNKKKALALLKRYLERGGKAKIEIPSIKHIRKAIDDDKLVIALLFGGALGEKEGGFHFVIVSGYKNGYVHINNPEKEARQGWFKEEDFFYALYTSTCVDIDNGSLLIVGK